MSTKTTFKRIALVTVAALGFGVLTSVAPASAAGPSTMSIPVTDLTIIGDTYGFVTINVVNAAGDPSGLAASESITATVIDTPKGIDSTTAASDILFALSKRTARATFADANGAAIAP